MNSLRNTARLNAGFTLIEMMIAVTIGLFILGAVSAVALNSGKSTRTNDRTSELQTNGRYALDVLRRDVQHAGYSGLTPPLGLVDAKQNGFFQAASGVTVTNDCSTGFSLKLEEPVWGVNDSNTGLTSCISNTNYLQGDILVVRYADMTAWNVATPTNAPSAAAANDIYFRSAYDASKIYQKGGTAPGSIGNGVMQDQLLKSYVYYISKNTTNTDGIPALYRLALNAGAMTPELVASGIENLQVRYAVTDTTGNTQYLDANTVTTNNAWPQVKSIRLWLLARNSGNERNEQYINATSYAMGDVNYTPAASVSQFRRQLYTATIDLRNL